MFRPGTGAAASAHSSGLGAAASSGGGRPDEDNDDGDWEDEDALDGLATTHRSCNPLAPLIRYRAKKKVSRGPNIRATQRKKRERKLKREQALAADILKHHESRDAEAQELADTHNIGVEEVKRRMMAGTKYRQTRKTSSYNALLALVLKDLNEVGSKLRMPEVKAMIKSDPTLKHPYTEEDIEDMQKALDEKKALRSMGIRGSNITAAIDAKWTIDSVTREITDMATRNNMVGFAMFVKGDLHDTHVPAAIESLGALKFFADVFHKDPTDVLALFELWLVTQKRGGVLPSTVAELQKASGEILRTGLQLITGKHNIAMNFERYIEAIVRRWGVGLLNWPSGVDFKCMSRQTTIGNLQTLYSDLKDRTCKWVKLSKKQQAEIEAEFEEMVRSGKRVEKIRQRRSNKGQTHQKRKRRVHRRGVNSGSEDEEDEEEDEDEDEDSDEELTPTTQKPPPVKKIRSAQETNASQESNGGQETPCCQQAKLLEGEIGWDVS
ncbi:hypothetical protein K438DRAFT_261032 [Mycena galopus ATCC 62051]|nr:hypothetical protein K438DRAFT_261032 [Mycena galopus ATCC 62051]